MLKDEIKKKNFKKEPKQISKSTRLTFETRDPRTNPIERKP